MFSSNTVLAKIALWQLQVREKMAALVRRAKQEKSLPPLASLILLAFAYGGLHAAEPGHGKAIAVSYMITRKPSYGRGLLFGAAVALFSVSLGLLGLGVILGLAISLGMAVTIAIVITIVVAGEKAAVHRLAGQDRRLTILETVCESGGGILVTALGVIFLAANL